MSLLSKAKTVKVDRVQTSATVDKELLELAIAYLKKEITLRQAATVLDASNSKAEGKMRSEIMKAVRTGDLS